MMNTDQLMKALKTIGMRVFIMHYNEFNNPSIQGMRLAGILQEQHGYKEKSCLVRAYTGKRIFQNKMQHDALRLIIKASHVEKETRDEAAQRLAAESDS